MGFPNNLHIRGFVQGKVVRDIEQRESGEIFISFEDGESLRLWATAKQPKVPDVEVLATPFQANGQVKQSVDCSVVCTRCEGDGKAHGSDRPFEWHGPGTYPGPCPVCKGSGVTEERRDDR